MGKDNIESGRGGSEEEKLKKEKRKLEEEEMIPLEKGPKDAEAGLKETKRVVEEAVKAFKEIPPTTSPETGDIEFFEERLEEKKSEFFDKYKNLSVEVKDFILDNIEYNEGGTTEDYRKNRTENGMKIYEMSIKKLKSFYENPIKYFENMLEYVRRRGIY
ncbi:MAG: hypothetical protein WCS86_03040 [Candidatus Paceibacterota bacterium]